MFLERGVGTSMLFHWVLGDLLRPSPHESYDPITGKTMIKTVILIFDGRSLF